MNFVKVAAAVMNQTPLDWDNNVANILEAIELARQDDVTLLCLPEMCITGYGCEDSFHAPHVYEMAWKIVDEEIRPKTAGMIVSVGLPARYTNGFYNTVCLIADQRVVGFVAKQHLAGGGLHYEPRWFKPWPRDTVSEIEFGAHAYPIGDIYFNCGGIKIGFEICEEAWVAQRPGSDLSFKGVDIILNPSASHFAFGKLETRKRFVIEGSRAFGVTYVYSNLLGNEAGRAVYDGGAMIATSGKMIAQGSRLSFKNVEVTSAVIDIETSRVNLARTVSHRPIVENERIDQIHVDFNFPSIEPVANPPINVRPWENSPFIKEEEFSRSVALSLFDYLRKSFSRGYVVSLSGGADSAAVSCLSALAMEFAVNELGLDRTKEKLGYINAIQNATSVSDIIHATLTCAYQSTENSGDITRDAASSVASALNAVYHELDVDSLVKNYTNIVEQAIGRKLTWETDDVTLQNIQARSRAPSIWMFANINNALLLSTSNRSEAAVGYATMDGDTAGGLSPVAGIDKAFLRQWLVWMEEQGPENLHTIPALSKINKQQPTAELRPAEEGQTDESDLMPYVLLDAIERVAIRDKKSPVDAYRLMRAKFPEYDPKQLYVWVVRFFKLWCRNQWKRERYAPSFHVDDESLDPKTWCRFPILSGGYKRELEILADWVEQKEKVNLETIN